MLWFQSYMKVWYDLIKDVRSRRVAKICLAICFAPVEMQDHWLTCKNFGHRFKVWFFPLHPFPRSLKHTSKSFLGGKGSNGGATQFQLYLYTWNSWLFACACKKISIYRLFQQQEALVLHFTFSTVIHCLVFKRSTGKIKQMKPRHTVVIRCITSLAHHL